ncbi:MAG: hypothetical protein Q8Q14_12575 [Gemmatimonadales bacterium]|nr:hypothetical protein [Gemmatimonadales bacterium]
MSILNKLRLNGHLDDTGLAQVWTEQSLTGVQASHTHLQSCADCRTRFASFGAWADGLRADAFAEAGDAFPAERLAAQQAQILRRLEAAERPARVIAFPKFSRPMSAGSSLPARWITVAAVAGLIVGVGVGQRMDLRHSFTEIPATTARLAKPPLSDRPVNPEIRAVSDTIREEAFLSEIDDSLSRASLPELRAFDAFTPRPGERPR